MDMLITNAQVYKASIQCQEKNWNLYKIPCSYWTHKCNQNSDLLFIPKPLLQFGFIM